jgi:hypothetical protein
VWTIHILCKNWKEYSKQITNGSREQLHRVSRNVIRSCEVFLDGVGRQYETHVWKKAKYNSKKNVDSKFPVEAFIDIRDPTTVTMLWTS